jgi:putative Mg2+ transporter-C (MgtC) family protein
MQATPLEEVELLGRLALAVVLAGVLGWERQMGQQPAGLRTHMLVSLGAAAFTVAGVYGVAGYGTVQDAGRVAAQIVVGIGFIGAGTIWRSTGNERVIRGLTTAASIWVAASIGMLCGYGLYVLAAGSAVITLAVLRLLRGLERLPGSILRRVASPVRVLRRGSGSTSISDGAEGDEPDDEPEEQSHAAMAETPMIERQRERRRKAGKKKKRRKAQAEPADVISDAG